MHLLVSSTGRYLAVRDHDMFNSDVYDHCSDQSKPLQKVCLASCIFPVRDLSEIMCIHY